MSMMIFKGYVHDVETKNINSSPMFEATVKHRMGYGDNAVTVFTRVSFWGQMAQIAAERIQKDCQVHITSEIKGGRLYTTKKGEPGFGMNCKGLAFDVLREPSESSHGGSWSTQQQSTPQQSQPNGGWGGGGYDNSNQGGWGNQGGNDPVPF